MKKYTKEKEQCDYISKKLETIKLKKFQISLPNDEN